MPTRKSPDTLRKVCLDNMVKHFDNLWCPEGKSWHDIDDIRDFPRLKGPITDIPSHLLEELMETMKDNMLLRRHHLHVLIRPCLERVNLASGIGDIYFALEFIQERCQNLQHLNLAYQKRLSPDALMQLMKSIPQVQTLELQHTQCVDQVMAIVGCYCHELRSLNVCSCPVSDYGLMGLCLNLKDNSGQCQKLVRLLVADTHVTTEGAAFAVCYLPNLKEFDFDDMFSVLDVMHFGTNLTSKVLSHSTRYGISQLLSNNDKVSDARLRMAIALCPFVSKVSFQDVNMTDQTLQGLAGLEHLKELSLGNGIKSQITFTGGIGPLLREVGRRLDKLQLSNVADVDVITLGKYCSRLRHLTLIHNHNYKSIVTYREPVFSHLRILEIICNDHSDMMSVVLNRVLFNCHRLTSVELKRCGGLNDNFIREITTVNPLKDLRKFYLQECNEITAKAVLELFAQENNLASIRLWSCSNITEADYFQMIDRVKSENWDVTLDWIGYQ